MWKNFYNWAVKHQEQINWFLVGLLTGASINSLADGEFISAAIYAVLAYVNYLGTKIRMQ